MKLKRTAVLAATVALATMAGALPAHADTVTSQVSGGSLSVTTAGVALSAVTLNGSTQSASGTTSTWTITDARGTGAAWSATVTATTPTSAAGSVETTARTIAVSNLKVSTGTVTAGTDSDPASGITGSTNLALSTGSQTVISATADHKGTYTLTPSFTLSVPANAYRSNYSGAVGSTSLNAYSSTVTYTIA